MAKETQESQGADPREMLSQYFSAGRNEEVAALDQEQMYTLLRQLEQTPYWIAVLKYTQQRLLVAQSSMNVIDPFKDATGIARNQGAMIGLVDLQNGVIQLVDEYNKENAVKPAASE